MKCALGASVHPVSAGRSARMTTGVHVIALDGLALASASAPRMAVCVHRTGTVWHVNSALLGRCPVPYHSVPCEVIKDEKYETTRTARRADAREQEHTIEPHTGEYETPSGRWPVCPRSGECGDPPAPGPDSARSAAALGVRRTDDDSGAAHEARQPRRVGVESARSLIGTVRRPRTDHGPRCSAHPTPHGAVPVARRGH